ncbi:16368_t:CDS:1, partial [Funneliformis caledonium]
MNTRRNRMNQSASARSTLCDFLNHVNYHNLNNLPYNSNENVLAAHARNGRTTQILTGKHIMKQNVKREAHRLRLRSNNRQYIIKLATEVIWNLRCTQTQRQIFINLANNANSINQSVTPVNNNDTLDRIARINTPQAAINPLERDLFNG